MKARPVRPDFDVDPDDVQVMRQALGLLEEKSLEGVTGKEQEDLRRRGRICLQKLEGRRDVFSAGELTALHVALQLAALVRGDPEDAFAAGLQSTPPERIQALLEKLSGALDSRGG